MLEDVQERIPQLDWSYFEKALLPPLRLQKGTTISSIVQTLRSDRAVVPVKGRDCWSAFAQGPPAAFASHSEDSVFAVIADIVKAVSRAYDAKTKMTAQYRSRPTSTPASEARTNKSKLDGYFMDSTVPGALTELPHRWRNIVVPSEYKLLDTQDDINANATQILWSLAHILRGDARRRFVFGFSIENTRMRLWFMSRSDVFVSFPEPNFTTAIERLVSFFIRIMFAERHELGFDETIIRRPTPDEHGGVQYDIQVGENWYRTQRLISAIGAESPRGRGTRVWEVKQLDKPGGTEFGPSLVLKDSWVDEDRLREVAVLREIRASVTDKDDLALLNTHLLTVHDAADVLVNGVPDDTHLAIRRGIPPACQDFEPVKKDPNADRQFIFDDCLLVDPQLAPEEQPREHVAYHRKVHHRVIFTEMGTTIMESETFSYAFGVLKEVVQALKILHKYGWVHRDISSGNILVVKGTAKLADVEYAKRETDDTTHNVRTGTAFFMATEVDVRCYRFDGPGQPPAVAQVPLQSGHSLPDIPEEDPAHDEEAGSTHEVDEGLEREDEEGPSLDKTEDPSLDEEGDSSPEDESVGHRSEEEAPREDVEDRSAQPDEGEPELQVQRVKDPRLDDSDSEDDGDEDGDDDVLPTITRPEQKIFRHNPIHDLESVLWLALYIVTCSILPRFHDTKKVNDALWEQYMKARRVLAAKLFGKDTNFRLNTIQPSTSFSSQLWDQHPQIALICGALDEFRALLVGQYQHVERQPGAITFASTMAHAIHDNVADILRKLSEDRRYSRVNGKNLRFSGHPTMLAQRREEMQSALDETSQATGKKRGVSEGSDGPRKKLNAARGNAYSQRRFIVRARAGVSDSVGETYKQR